MKIKYSLISLILAFAIVFPAMLAGCGKSDSPDASTAAAGDAENTVSGKADDNITVPSTVTAVPATEVTEPLTPVTGTVSSSDPVTEGPDIDDPVIEAKYEFNPHLHSDILEKFYPREWWDSLYSLCDAVRNGSETFECVSKEAYDWCLSAGTLANMLPAASVVIKGSGDDGTVPFENGVGRIYYNGITPNELAVREKRFEKFIEDVLNDNLEPDDTDFEKSLKLYNYIESNYVYEHGSEGGMGYTYYTFMNKKGVCDNFAGIYTYLLLQAGVEAISIDDLKDADHSWVYLIIDGEGYHSDPTWALYGEGEDFYLTYFLMTEKVRNSQGCSTDDLTAEMIPGFWLSKTGTELPATSDKFDMFGKSVFVSLDEVNKIITFKNNNRLYELKYE